MKVIFNGDDFGLTPGINKAIIRSFQEGLLRSASLVSNGEASEEAIALAKANPELDVGVHLVLSDETPLLPPNRLLSIISSGSSFPSRNHILKRIMSRKIDHGEVENEWRAQVERVMGSGIQINHLDSHQYLHLFPGLLNVCLNIAEEYQIPFVRGSTGDAMSLTYGLRRLIQWSGLALWSRWVASCFIPDHVRVLASVGFLASGGRLDTHTLMEALSTLRLKKDAPAVEVILHPGMGDAYTASKYERWGYQWKNDFDLLMDSRLTHALLLQDMIPASFEDVLNGRP